ncbi:signal transduction histidine kinase [Methylopila capsulata]|uniref:histidine kinase n=1 Tax=Methylopila capsulata TaxID=61654 RepID=A0A9W6IWW6_9HYPH|nr:HAMP domain-containing sensor histidine kinase [Methylopila capsulata]MBM7852446.1 signal transduction histidine kinase [Methylopila capsulata]GLK56655.1 two-component sensor histidine kinase [Methylopila capsulata]
MRRLFWKFFFTIWICITASIVVLFAFNTVFQISPFLREVERGRREFALDAAARLLERDGRGAADAFVALAAQMPNPVALTIAPSGVADACATAKPDERAVVRGGACHRISARWDVPDVVAEIWPKLLPWLSALLAAAAAAYGLARHLIRPVVDIRVGLNALAHGRFDVRIADKMGGRRDEVSELAHDLDASAARLEDFQRTQRRLFHDVSHELRSPLSRLQAAMGVLQQNPGKLGSMMDRMGREVDRIDSLVGEILTLARLSDGSKSAIARQRIDVLDLINDIVADAVFEAESRGVRVSHDGAPSFVAEVNGELIYRAIENVIRNAIKYTSDGSRVMVRSEVAGDTLLIRVTDEGRGVKPSELQRIFQPFSRGAEADAEGFGLGLAIAKQAIERHGGRADAAVADAGGLTVTLSIPRNEAARNGA